MDLDKLKEALEGQFEGLEVSYLGSGGFAATFRIRDGELDRAVKVLDPEKADQVREEREEIALKEVSSPNVVAYRGTSEVICDGVAHRFLEMDFVEGEQLQATLESQWPLTNVMKVARGLIDGAAAIWAAGLAHRDLSPKNILLRPDGTPVIVDLGIARHLDLETVTTLPTPGTPGWMAPEQVGDDPKHGDWRSDQFVIGLVIYRLCTGVNPFRANSRYERWKAPAEQTLRPPKAINPELPAPLNELIVQMTARQPFERFLQVDGLKLTVERAAEAVEAGEEVPVERSVKFGLAQGVRKNFADADFYTQLKADLTVLDARCMNEDKTRELVKKARDAESAVVIDPVSYFDRSPTDARHSGYRELSYGDGERLVGFSDDAARRAYVDAIVEYQRRFDVSAMVAPYFFAAADEMPWLEESLEMASFAADSLKESGVDAEIWTAGAVSASVLRGSKLDAFLNLLTAAPPSTFYLLVAATQPVNAPLSDLELLEGMRKVIDTCNRAGTKLIFGRRHGEGLLLSALGASGFTVGHSGTHQNMHPPPEKAEDESGGQGHDWCYVPRLLNSLSLPRRAAVHGAATDLFELNDPFGEATFAGNPARSELGQDTAARRELARHNFVALRQQAAELADTPPAQRVPLMRQWVEDAQAAYSRLGGPWEAAEGPAFLETWLKLL